MASSAPPAEVQEEELAALQSLFAEDFALEKPVWGSASFSISICALPQQLCVELQFTYSKQYPRTVPTIEVKPCRTVAATGASSGAAATGHTLRKSLPSTEFPRLKQHLCAAADRFAKDKLDSPFVFQLVELARDFLHDYVDDQVRKRPQMMGRMEVDLRKDTKLFPPTARPLVPLLRASSLSADHSSPMGTAPNTPRFLDQQHQQQVIENPRIARRGGRYLLDFEELERLGKGGFGVVVKARNRLDGMTYAVKQIRLPKNNEEALRKTRNEVTTLARLIHPNIVRYFMSWLEDNNADDEDDEDDDDEDDDEDDEEEEEDDDDDDEVSAFDLSTSLLRPPSAFSNYDDADYPSSSGSSSSSSEESSSSSSSEEEEEETYSTSASKARNSSSSSSAYLTLFIVMEYVPRTLRRMIDQGELIEKEERCFAIIREILEALAAIHELSIVHHDIKPDNLLIDQAGRVKLGDFGLAVVRNKNQTTSGGGDGDGAGGAGGQSEEEVGGTALYRAPELSLRRPAGGGTQWDEKCDIFSLGVVVVEMFSKPMTTSMERIKTLSALKNKPIQLPPALPLTVQNLATLLLQSDPKKRPSASQAYAKAIPTHLVSSQVDSLIKANLVPSSMPYKRLLKYFFAQLPTPEMDDAFDFKDVSGAGGSSGSGGGGSAFLHDTSRNRGHALRIYSELSSANVLPPSEALVPVERELTVLLMESRAKEVFQRLGFAAFHAPLLAPASSSLASELYQQTKSKRKPVSLIDQTGVVVDLPHLSLTHNFARFVAKTNAAAAQDEQLTFMKRFDTGYTFWANNAQGGQPSSEKQFCADVVCSHRDVQDFGLLAMMLAMYDAAKQVLLHKSPQQAAAAAHSGDVDSNEIHLEIGHALFLPKLFDLVKVPKSARAALVALVCEKRQFKDWKECQAKVCALGLSEQCAQNLRFCLPIANRHFTASWAGTGSGQSSTSANKEWMSEEWYDKPAFLESLVKQTSEQVMQDCGLADMIDFANFASRFNIKFRLVAWIPAAPPPDTTGVFFRCIMRSRRPKHHHHHHHSGGGGEHKSSAVTVAGGAGGAGAGAGAASSSLYEYGHEFVAADCGRFDDLIKSTAATAEELVGLGLRVYTERIARLRTQPNSAERFLTKPLIRLCAPAEKDAAKFEDEERYRVATRLRQEIPAHVGCEWVHPKGLSFEALFSLAREQGARVVISKAVSSAAVGGEEWRVRAVSFATELHTLGNFTDKRMQSWEELVKTVTQLVRI